MNRKTNSDHYQIPLMFAFREAARNNDARRSFEEEKDGEKVVSSRGSVKRRGATDELLKKNFTTDIVALLNTVDLASVIDLERFGRVGKSVLNFGLYDITHLTSLDAGVERIQSNLMAAILQHEPRIHADSLAVEREEVFDDVNQRIRFNISAEMSCRPFDIPVEFVAELDVGSGKLRFGRTPSGA